MLKEVKLSYEPIREKYGAIINMNFSLWRNADHFADSSIFCHLEKKIHCITQSNQDH